MSIAHEKAKILRKLFAVQKELQPAHATTSTAALSGKKKATSSSSAGAAVHRHRAPPVLYRRPRGRARKGCVWNARTGTWEPAADATTAAPASAPTTSAHAPKEEGAPDDSTVLSFPPCPPPSGRRFPTIATTRETSRRWTKSSPLPEARLNAPPLQRATDPGPSHRRANIIDTLDSPARRTRKRLAEHQGPNAVEQPPATKRRSWCAPNDDPPATPTPPPTSFPPEEESSSRPSSGASLLEYATGAAAWGGSVANRTSAPSSVREIRCPSRENARPSSHAESSSALQPPNQHPPKPRTPTNPKPKTPTTIHRSTFELLFDGPDAAEVPKPNRPSSSAPLVRRARSNRANSTRQPVPASPRDSDAGGGGVPAARRVCKPTQMQPAVITTNPQSPVVNDQATSQGRRPASNDRRLLPRRGSLGGARSDRDTEELAVPPPRSTTDRGAEDVPTSSLEKAPPPTQAAGAPTEEEAPLRRKRGRPKGSKNKPIVDAALVTAKDLERRPTSADASKKAVAVAPLRRIASTNSRAATVGLPPTLTEPAPGPPRRKRGRPVGSKNKKTVHASTPFNREAQRSELGGGKQEPPASSSAPRTRTASPSLRMKRLSGERDQDDGWNQSIPEALPLNRAPVTPYQQTNTTTSPEVSSKGMDEHQAPRDSAELSGARMSHEAASHRESGRSGKLKKPSESRLVHPKCAPAVAFVAPLPAPNAIPRDPVMVAQHVAEPPKRPRGRPKGSASHSKQSQLLPMTATAAHANDGKGTSRSSAPRNEVAGASCGACTSAPFCDHAPTSPRRLAGASRPTKPGMSPRGGPPAIVAAPALTTKHVYMSCGLCSGCRLDIDCGSCLPCKQTLNFRGLTLLRPVCVQRICTNPTLQKVQEAADCDGGVAGNNDEEVQSLSGDADSYLEGDLSDVSSLGH